MNVLKVVLMIVNHDELEPNEVKSVIEAQRFPNRCIHPDVMDIQDADIGEWHDDNPLNFRDRQQAEFERLFPDESRELREERDKWLNVAASRACHCEVTFKSCTACVARERQKELHGK